MNKAALLKITTSAVMVLLCGCATSPSASSIRNTKLVKEANTQLNQVYDGNIHTIQSAAWRTEARIPFTSNHSHYKTGPAQNILEFWPDGIGMGPKKIVDSAKLSNALAQKAAETNDAKLYFYAGYLSPGSPADGLRSNMNSSAYLSYFNTSTAMGKYGLDTLNYAGDNIELASSPIYSSYKMQTQAFHYFQKSAELGYKPANFFVGLYYLYGAGVPQNFKKALFYLKKSPPEISALKHGFLPDVFISNIYADRTSGYTNYYKAYHYIWLADHAQNGTDNGTPLYPNAKSTSLHGTVVNRCRNSDVKMGQKWIGWKRSLNANSLGASLPQDFSSSYYGYAGKLMHRLTIEAVKLKYIPAMEYELNIDSPQNGTSKTLPAYHQYILTMYNTYGDNAGDLCYYYNQSGIMPAGVKETIMAQTGDFGPCGNHRASEEALKLMGKYVPCSNVEQGPQYIHKAIEMVEARYPAEH